MIKRKKKTNEKRSNWMKGKEMKKERVISGTCSDDNEKKEINEKEIK